MSDSDEDARVLLDEQSMDEVHELDDAMQVSIDTNASISPTRRRTKFRSSSGDSENSSDGAHNDFKEDASDSDSDVGASDEFGHSFDDEKIQSSPSLSDAESDEPPEIPGSPLAQKHDPGGYAIPGIQAPADTTARKVDILKLDEDEYEAKETEQPRAMEFHTSSSSESESDEDQEGNGYASQFQSSAYTKSDRPKTAAKELEKYRDAVPEEFFQKIDNDADDAEVDYESEKDTIPKDAQSIQIPASSHNDNDQRKKNVPIYKVHVPVDVQELFSLVDAYTPEDNDIGSRLEPFLPDFVPSVGLPFDGIDIPRPDGKEDQSTGVDVLHEAADVSNTVELELLMQVALASDRKMRTRSEATRSIDDAAHHPKAIDQWIASVAKVQASKPLPQVHYKKPMPTIESLIGLWPEEFEQVLSEHANILEKPGGLASLNLELKEMVRLVCVFLDIPVYDGLQVHSLHMLFTLYGEVEKYEQEQEQAQQQQAQFRYS